MSINLHLFFIAVCDYKTLIKDPSLSFFICSPCPLNMLVFIFTKSIYLSQIKGLPEALKDPDSLVASNYSPDTVEKTFANMRRFRGGNAIFTFPPMPIKCPGAPQKIMYLADDYWRKVSRPASVC